jgi:hypothetical protein
MRDKIARLFQDGWKHKRIDAELAKAEAKRAVRVEAATRTVRALQQRSNNGAKSLKNNKAHGANASTITSLSKDKERGRARASGEPHASPALGRLIANVVETVPEIELTEEERRRRIARLAELKLSLGMSLAA